jgi:hypothetical protein
MPAPDAATAASPNSGDLRILFLPFYEDLPSLRARTFAGVRQRRQKRGLREALQRRGDVIEIDFRRLARRGPGALAARIEQAARESSANLVISEFHDDRELPVSSMIALRRRLPAVRWVNWNGDYRDPATWRPEYLRIMACFDLNLTLCMDGVHALRRHGMRAAYWQFGCEPDGVIPGPPESEPIWDVLFLGNCYSPARARLGEALRNSGVRVHIVGSGWPIGWAKRNTLYDFRGNANLIRSARLVIGDSQWPEADGFVSDRWFQSFAAGGAMVLHQYFKGYDRLGFVDRTHFVMWRDLDHLILETREWLDSSHEQQRRRIAEAGHSYCLTTQSFDTRVSELIELLDVPAVAAHG